MAFGSQSLVDGYINGYGLSRNAVTPASKLDIATGECADGGNTLLIASTSVLTVDIAVAGANGLDTGAEAASTLYAVWVIRKDDNTIAGLLSASFTAPTMPAGYTTKRRIGSWHNDAASNFAPGRQRSAGRERTFRLDAALTLVDDTFPIAETYVTVTTVIGGANAAEMAIDVFLNIYSNVAANRICLFSENAVDAIFNTVNQGVIANRQTPYLRMWPDSGGRIYYRGNPDGSGTDLSCAIYQEGYTEWL